MACVLCILPYMQSIRNVDRRFEGLPEKDMSTIAIASPLRTAGRGAIYTYALVPSQLVMGRPTHPGLAWRGVAYPRQVSIA